MKTICLYNAQLHLAGGIESVVRDLYRILPQGGIRVVAACEYGKPDWIRDEDFLLLTEDVARREEAWRVFLSTNAVDCVVFNHVSVAYFSTILDDVRHIRAFGVKCVKMCHSSFVTPLLVEGEELDGRLVARFGAVCDAMFTVSRIDAVWWAALGRKAIKILNPIRLPRIRVAVRHHADIHEPVNVLWVGRFSPPKKPEVALAALARARKLGANVRLTMIGGRQQDLKSYHKLAERYGVSCDVVLFPARTGIDDLWKKADIHLLTSVTESFCLVLAEAKAAGIPTVMFDLPNIELAASRKGLVEVPQGDVEGMAAALSELASDPLLRERLGREAQESLRGFDDEHVLSDWEAALRALETGEGFASATDELRVIVSLMSFGWDSYCDRKIWLSKMAENACRIGFPLRFLSRVLASLVQNGRNVRRFLFSVKRS